MCNFGTNENERWVFRRGLHPNRFTGVLSPHRAGPEDSGRKAQKVAYKRVQLSLFLRRNQRDFPLLRHFWPSNIKLIMIHGMSTLYHRLFNSLTSFLTKKRKWLLKYFCWACFSNFDISSRVSILFSIFLAFHTYGVVGLLSGKKAFHARYLCLWPFLILGGPFRRRSRTNLHLWTRTWEIFINFENTLT